MFLKDYYYSKGAGIPLMAILQTSTDCTFIPYFCT